MTKSAEPTFDEMYPSEVTRKGIRFHMASAVWDYGRRNMLPLWTDFVHCPIVLPVGYKFSQTSVPNTEFEYILEGQMVIEQGGVRTILKPHDLWILPAGTAQNLTVRENCRKITAGISGQLVHSQLSGMGIFARPVIRIGNDERLLSVIHELYQLLREKSEETVPHISGLTLELVMEIGRAAKTAPSPRLAEAIHILERGIADEIRLDEVAARLHISTDFLNRLFRQELGITPKRYLIEQRMHLASSLLTNSDFSVQEISLRCGYRNQFAFSREFRKKYGLSPLQFRKNARKLKKI